MGLGFNGKQVDSQVLFVVGSLIYIEKFGIAVLASRKSSHVGRAIVTLRSDDGTLLAKIAVSEIEKAIRKRRILTEVDAVRIHDIALEAIARREDPVAQQTADVKVIGGGIRSLLINLKAEQGKNRVRFMASVGIAALALGSSTLLLPKLYEEHALKEAVRENLVDPNSAIFGEILIDRERYRGPRACVSVNAKNRMGGYGGGEVFFLERHEQSSWRVVSSTAEPPYVLGHVENCEEFLNESQF